MTKLKLSAALLFMGITCVAQWNPVNNGINNLATGARLIGASNTNLFAVSIASGVYKTSDYGNNWTQVQVPVGFTSPPKCGYYFSGKYFVGMDNSTDCISYTSDEGMVWTTPTGGPQTTVVRGFLDFGGDIFTYTSSKGIFKSTDGGSNWSAANSGLTNLNIAWMTTINTKLVAATIGAGVFVSSDNGATWVQSNTGISGNLNSTFVWSMGANLYFYTQQGNLYYSSKNEGANWASATRPSFLQSNAIGKTISIKEVYKKGTNIYMIAKTQYGISISDSVYISSNEGVSWKNITENLPADILGSGLTEYGGQLFIAYGSANTGIYRNSIVTETFENYVPNLIEVYPNPFSDKLFVSNFSNERVKQIAIYDNQGKLVLTRNNEDGLINTTELPNGLYTIQLLLADDTTIKKKLIK
jgi:photosystem II stability/assembly factor-like uncharacterized protein